jgi:hypothetical protein
MIHYNFIKSLIYLNKNQDLAKFCSFSATLPNFLQTFFKDFSNPLESLPAPLKESKRLSASLRFH